MSGLCAECQWWTANKYEQNVGVCNLHSTTKRPSHISLVSLSADADGPTYGVEMETPSDFGCTQFSET